MRSTKPYHKRFHGDALQGYRHLSLELRGAYTTLLDVMYDHGGPIDERFACVHLDCDPRVWKRLKAALVDQHAKIWTYTDDAGVTWLGNKRVQEMLGLPTYAELVANLRPKSAIANAEPEPKSDKTINKNKEPKNGFDTESENALVKPEPVDSVPNGTGAERLGKPDERLAVERRPPDGPPDPDREAWDRGVAVLIGRGRMKPAAARSLIGKWLKGGIPPRQMLPSIVRAELLNTQDPQSYLGRCADRIRAEWLREQGSAEAERKPWGVGEWRAAVTMCAETGRWGEACGPRPGEPGCLAPRAVLLEFGFAPPEGGDVIPFDRSAA